MQQTREPREGIKKGGKSTLLAASICDQAAKDIFISVRERLQLCNVWNATCWEGVDRAVGSRSGWKGGKGAGGRAELDFPLSSQGAVAKDKAIGNQIKKKNNSSLSVPWLLTSLFNIRVMESFIDDDPGLDTG